ncbi:olfactory receptor 226-like [Gastrophryne carolinensis]
MNYSEAFVTEFLLLGFTVSRTLEIFLFLIIITIYMLSIVINCTIILIFWNRQQLHKPMYFFISVFSFLEIWYPTVTVPSLLGGLLLRVKTICFGCCVAQFYFHFALGATENCLLVVMAFDRYIAICKPLHYIVIMKKNVCVVFAVGSWVGGFTAMTVQCIQLSKVTFCGPNRIDHYYCDFAPLIKLACSDSSHLQTLFFVISCLGILSCFLLILVSYVFIVYAVLKIPTSTGRYKTFYTCASHMTVVLIFYVTTIFMFARPPKGSDVHVNKMVSVFPSVVTPLLNPIIYSLRNQDVKNELWKVIHCM